MKILHLSDTHCLHRDLAELPEADIIVHSGDFTMAGSEAEAYDFMNWFSDLPHPYKIFIAGNHDFCMYGANSIEGLPPNVHYLCNSGTVIDDIRVYGVPMFMQDCIAGLYDRYLLDIPCGVDIVITHQPPYGILDFSDYGSGPACHGDVVLRKRIFTIKPRLHLFGHEHSCYGIEKCHGMTFSNAAVLDDDYNLIRAPILLALD